MAPQKGKKKKTKQATNPARGVATTSIPKAVKNQEDESVSSPTKQESSKTPTPNASVDAIVIEPTKEGKPLKSLPELSPEEFESRLEENELQIMVDDLGPKVRKESARHVSRLNTDRRALRAQSLDLPTFDWISDDLTEKVLSLLRREIDQRQHQGRTDLDEPLPAEQDLLFRFWTLQFTLEEIGFANDRIQEALKNLLLNTPKPDSTSQPWGLQESLDYLAIACTEEELRRYDGHKILITPNPESSTNSGVSSPTRIPPGLAPSVPRSQVDSPQKQEIHSPLTEDVSGVVSDVPSDAEPEDLLSIYLSTQSRLFSIDPSLTQLASNSKAKNSKSKKQQQPTSSKSTPLEAQKLVQRLEKVKRDMLFDKDEAERQWNDKRIAMLRSRKADSPRKWSNDPFKTTPKHSDSCTSPEDIEPDKSEQQESPSGEDAPDMLGGMFDSVLGLNDPPSHDTGNQPSIVTVRSFDHIGGVHPRRVLLDACRARDPGVKIEYEQASATTFSCRHRIRIIWTKPQLYSNWSPSHIVSVSYEPTLFVCTMTDTAAPDVQQSEAFVSTAALFFIFSSFAREEKSYMRLPGPWREFWSELAALKKEDDDAKDRSNLKGLRHIIREELDRIENDDVVLTKSFRRRNGAQGRSQAEKDLNSQLDFFDRLSPEECISRWTHVSSSSSYQRMLKSRQTLPMFEFKKTAISAIEDNQIMILSGETGCGKSTQLPAFVLENELSNGRHCKICCTEPRRISAISLAQRVIEELGEPKHLLGSSKSLVGYQVRFDSRVSKENLLVYATVGTILRTLESSQSLSDITHLVIDEVHERSIETDFLLVIVRSLAERRPDLKIILMSATVDAERFSRYLGGAPVVSVPGRTYPVLTQYLEDAIELTRFSSSGNRNYPEDDDENEAEDDPASATTDSAEKNLQGYSQSTLSILRGWDEYRVNYGLIVQLLKKIYTSSDHTQYCKAILIFMPGMMEIRRLNDMLHNDDFFGSDWLIYALHSAISNDDQMSAFNVPPVGMHKVVIATNIAETGITIPDVTCVIDTGVHKEMRFDERRQLSRLVQTFISRANAKQRRGRAGRVQEGLCFHLFTKHRYRVAMLEHQTPEMLRLSLQELVMRIKICNLGDVQQILQSALDPPQYKNIRRAIDALTEVGALALNESLTPLGQQIARIPVDAMLGKLVLLGAIFGCLDAVLTIAALISSKSIFAEGLGGRKQADLARQAFKKGDSDLLTAYNAYSSWRRICNTSESEFQFCRKNGLSAQQLASVEDLKAQLLKSVVDAGFVTLDDLDRAKLRRFQFFSKSRVFVPMPTAVNANNANDTLIASVIAWAFHPKILIRDGKGWRNINNNQTVSLPASSVNKGITTVRFLSYHDMMQASGTKLYNANSTSIVYELPLLLFAGEVDFRLHAGVVTLDSNRVRFKVGDWKTMVVIKMLRRKAKAITSAILKSPGKPLPPILESWNSVLLQVLAKGGMKRE
ncbi:helicase associated domain-containing protein [Lineolata rhizophorae]|uniref:RNA helicase n=1 Tax=Lineolata rhizophorae TaxID=578093 RepID=A0A6A6P0M4_9PEZI|nr:helicase associated domain-containing protein [Lineolata rhizophorae]